MIKYTDALLEYKDSFGNTAEIVKNTDTLFTEKYFPGGISDKKFNPPFLPGVIYSFLYTTDSKIDKKRKFINRNPIIICIDSHVNKDNELIVRGIDLITVPPDYKIKILSRIHDTYYDKIESNESYYNKKGPIDPLPLTDRNLKSLLENTGYTSSLFGFRAKFMKDIKIVDLEDWYKLPYLRKSMVEGSSLQGIYTEYQSKLI